MNIIWSDYHDAPDVSLQRSTICPSPTPALISRRWRTSSVRNMSKYTHAIQLRTRLTLTDFKLHDGRSGDLDDVDAKVRWRETGGGGGRRRHVGGHTLKWVLVVSWRRVLTDAVSIPWLAMRFGETMAKAREWRQGYGTVMTRRLDGGSWRRMATMRTELWRRVWRVQMRTREYRLYSSWCKHLEYYCKSVA